MLKPVVSGLNLTAHRADGGHLPCSDLVERAKLNDVDLRAWLADVLKRLPIPRPSAPVNSRRGTGKPDSSSQQRGNLHGRRSVIDNPDQVEHLVGRLREALPIPATASAPLLALLKERSPSLDLQPLYRVPRIDYAGDEGGIVCQLDFLSEDGREVPGHRHLEIILGHESRKGWGSSNDTAAQHGRPDHFCRASGLRPRSATRSLQP